MTGVASAARRRTVGTGWLARAMVVTAALALLFPAAVDAGPFAYLPVPQLPTGLVYAFDTATNSLRFPIAVGTGPCGIAVNPAGTAAYVANCVSGTVTVIDTATNRATGTLELGSPSPCARVGVAVHPTGRFLYVAGFLGVIVLDLETRQIVTVVPAAGCTLAVDPGGDFLYVDNARSVDIVSTSGYLFLRSVLIPCPPVALGCAVDQLAVNPAGTLLYATHKFDGVITVIDPVARSVVTSFQITGSIGTFGAVVVDPAGAFLYAARVQEPAGDVVVISTVTNLVVATLPIGGVSSLALGLGGGTLYAAQGDTAHTVVAVDTATLAVTTRFSTLACQLCEAPGPPVGLAVGGPGDRPGLVASVNQPLFAEGETLDLTAGVDDPGVAGAADFYAGIVLPDGEHVAFLTADGGFALGSRSDPGSFRAAATGVDLETPLAVSVPGFVSHQWTGDEPRGEYAFFLLAMPAGAAPSLEGADVLGLAVAPFAFP
jgi:YVTN family beta-propeller protein